MNQNIREKLDALRQQVEEQLVGVIPAKNVPLFHEPIAYVNALKGKRLRPLLVLLYGLNHGGSLEKLLRPAVAIELLHNFTLVHDDIMDNDETRRGKPTVHVKWDLATAVLAGDGLLGLAYQALNKLEPELIARVVPRFTDAMVEICEGQALDKTFEVSDEVSEAEYLNMIGKKTAVLISLACEMGAIVAGLEQDAVDTATELGFQLGMAFQIQDDVLDIVADEQELGKKVGSDLAMNKKTILTIKLREVAGDTVKGTESIEEYITLLNRYGILESARKMEAAYFSRVDELMESLPQNENKEALISLIEYIKNRKK
jgi:geranylgeranyl pyrophosphate synthase